MSIISISGRIGSGKDTVGKIIQYLTWKSHFKDDKYTYESFLETRGMVNVYKIKKFADSLKAITCILLGCSLEQLEDRDFKETELGEEWWYYKIQNPKGYGTIMIDYLSSIKYDNLVIHKLTPRLLLQLLGTECGRNIIHPNIWVNALFAKYKPYNEKETLASSGGFKLETELIYPNWIITDTRFPNELKAVKDRGGITIGINGRVLCRDINGEKHSLTYKEYLEFKQSEEKKGWIFQQEHESETALDGAEFDYVINNDKDIPHLIEEVKKILVNENLL